MKLVVCGDSFASICSWWAPEDQWPHQLGRLMGMESISLGRGAADNLYIHAQVKHAIYELKASHIVIWPTSIYRVSLPIKPEDYHSREYSVQTVETHHNPDETNYSYDGYDPKYMSYHLSNHTYPRLGPREKKAFDWYVAMLYDKKLAEYTNQIILNDAVHECSRNKVKTLINTEIDWSESNPSDDNGDFPRVDSSTWSDEFVRTVRVNIPGGIGDASPNHFAFRKHPLVAEFFAEEFAKL